MTTPHKHAEVLRAIADGKEVEGRPLGSKAWQSYSKYLYVRSPFTDPDWEWRVKPEKKPDIKVKAPLAQMNESVIVLGYYANPNITLTFDGETGKLIKAEVIK